MKHKLDVFAIEVLFGAIYLSLYYANLIGNILIQGVRENLCSMRDTKESDYPQVILKKPQILMKMSSKC
jgi:hypothetical protein